MTRLAAAVCLLACLGCATSGSIGQSATVYAEKDRLWLAAQSAIQDIGGRIVMSNRTAGTVVGRIEVEGTPINLTVSISGSPELGSSTRGYWDVDVRGSIVGEPEPDEEWQRRLTYFEQQVIDRINAAGFQPTRSGTDERPTRGLLGPATPIQPPE